MAHPGGRPSKYRRKYCKMLIDYFNKEPMEIKLVVNKKGEEEPIEIPAEYPTFEGFANKIGVTTTTIVNWTVDNPEFLTAYNKAKAYQKDILIQNGLRGNYNCLFAKFVAINATDMKEKVEYESRQLNMNVDFTGLSEEEAKELYKKKQEELKNE